MNPAHVFIIEDDENIREVMKLLLDLEGISTLWAESGGKALDLIDQFESKTRPMPCMVMVDGKLPDIHGVELISIIRKRLPEKMPIYLFSANSDYSCFAKNSKDISGFIDKPFSTDELLSLIRRNIDSAFALRQEGFQPISAA